MSSSLLNNVMRGDIMDEPTTPAFRSETPTDDDMHVDPRRDNTTNTPALRSYANDTIDRAVRAPYAPRTPAVEPCFIPGHIRVNYRDSFAAMVPLQILPAQHYGTHWTAENLAWEAFVRLTEERLDTTLQNKLLLAHVGQPQLLEIRESRDWYVALQMCHDMGLNRCAFRLLQGDVVVGRKPEPRPVQQVHERGWGGAVATVGTVGAVTAAAVAGAVQMGFLPGFFFG